MSNKVWVYIQNLGDGSVDVRYFSTEKLADAYAKFDDERLCDDIFPEDLDNLEIDPVHWRADEIPES
jgi:hypothetical protein